MQISDSQTFAGTKKKPHVPIWLDVVVLLICIAISYLKPVPFPWKVPLIAAIIVGHVAVIHKNPGLIGIGKFRWKSTLFWAIIIAVIVVVGISNIINPIVSKLLNKGVDTSAFDRITGNFNFVASFWWKAMISAAVAEEIFYRGYLFFVLERIAGNGRIQKIIIVLLAAAYFGWSHSPQGITGVIGITLTAIVIGSGYYLSRKNLYAIILAHALIDTWSLFSLYKGGISFFF